MGTFFSTSRYEPPYRQIAVNVPGKYACFRYGEEDKDWDSGAKVISSSDSGHWQISLALPLDKLLPDGIKTGDAFYANFYRQVTSTGELLAWSPNFNGNFHELKRMGKFTLGQP